MDYDTNPSDTAFQPEISFSQQPPSKKRSLPTWAWIIIIILVVGALILILPFLLVFLVCGSAALFS